MEGLLFYLKSNDFPLEFFLASLAMIWPLKKKRHLPLRLGAFVLLHVLLFAGLSRLSSMHLPTAFWVLGIMVLYGMEIGMFLFCTRVSFWDAIFGTVCAHAIQHLAYVIYLIAAGFFPWRGWADLGAEFLIFSLTVLLCGRFFIRRLCRRGRFYIEPREVLRALFIVLVVAIGLNLLVDFVVQGETEVGVLVIIRIYAAFCCMFALWIQAATNEKAAMEAELRTREALWMQQKEQYTLSRENIDLINQKCHDLKHLLGGLRFVSDEKKRNEVLDEVEHAVMIYDSVVKTGHPALDTILTERSLFCEKEGITWTCMADGSRLDFLDSVELYTVFGNALDNAIESAQGLDDPEKRVVSVSIFAREQFLILQVENYYTGQIRMRDGLPETTKGDRRYHGFGLKSIRSIVERYGGTMTIDLQDQIFLLSIILPIPGAP